MCNKTRRTLLFGSCGIASAIMAVLVCGGDSVANEAQQYKRLEVVSQPLQAFGRNTTTLVVIKDLDTGQEFIANSSGGVAPIDRKDRR